MKTVKDTAAQGEIYIRRIEKPGKDFMKNGTPLAPAGGRLIIGHSETGHHHVIADGEVMVKQVGTEAGVRVLRMIVEKTAHLTHERETDTHEALRLPPGHYEVRLDREFDPFQNVTRAVVD